MEDTHIKDPIRLRKLFALCAIAFLICFIVGLIADKITKIEIKNHGYKANSFFRHGLNNIRKALKINKKDKYFIQIKNNINLIFDYIEQILHDNFLQLQKIVM